MTGEPQMQEGLTGIVRFVDDVGGIHVNWENGSTLALLPDEDDFEIVREQQGEIRHGIQELFSSF